MSLQHRSNQGLHLDIDIWKSMQTKAHVKASQDEKKVVHHLFIYFCRLQPKYIPTNLKAI